MRIAYVCLDPGVPVFGHKGCSIHVQEVVRAMRKRGAQVKLFATRRGGHPPSDLASVPVVHLPIEPAAPQKTREQAAISANQRLYPLLSDAAPFDVVYERYSLWSYNAMQYAQDAAVSGVLEVNAPLIDEQARHRKLILREAAEQATHRALAAATAVIAVSREVGHYLCGFPAARGRVHVVPNGVNPDRFPNRLRPSRPGPRGCFTVGFIGSLKPWHGLSHLVEAFAMLQAQERNTRLLIVGDGPERPRLLQQLAGKSQELLDAVDFTGAVPAKEVPGLLASMDVGVAPYPKLTDFYFSPLKIYEYLAAGVPVVASRIGQAERMIRDGVDGILCPPGDPLALAAALQRLRREPIWRREMGSVGRARVLRDHTWDRTLRRIFSVCSGLA